MTEIERQIADEIHRNGPVPFSRFMELALYCPVYGFYEKEADTIGRRGHFMTSVSVGSLFGELLAFRFSRWIDQHSTHWPRLLLVEAGAHDGKLASDILNWFGRHRSDLLERVTYVILEASERRRGWQAERLGGLARDVHWAMDLKDLERSGIAGVAERAGIIFSNEFLDAFPVHRLSWDRQKRIWTEQCVTIQDGRFAWWASEEVDTNLLSSLGELEAVREHLPDGYIVEVSPAAGRWWTLAAKWLGSGLLLTCDYGMSSEDQLRPERMGGTLRAYHRHSVSDKVLDMPGEQDLTSHVNFPAIIQAGEAAGLKTELFHAQGRFLTRLATEIPAGHSFALPWDAARNRQFATLTHPDHLGQVFKVLVQRKG